MSCDRKERMIKIANVVTTTSTTEIPLDIARKDYILRSTVSIRSNANCLFTVMIQVLCSQYEMFLRSLGAPTEA